MCPSETTKLAAAVVVGVQTSPLLQPRQETCRQRVNKQQRSLQMRLATARTYCDREGGSPITATGSRSRNQLNKNQCSHAYAHKHTAA